jgi:hypothetical protein
VDTLAALVVAAIAVATLRAYVNEGMPGVRKWWRLHLVGAAR